MEWANLILEYLKVFVSWPVAIVLTAIIFRGPICGLIGRVRSLTVTGVQIHAIQQTEKTTERDAQINPPPPPLPGGLTLTPEQQKVLVQVFQAERAAARLWEYRFLNYFLARGTQLVLDWLVSLGQVTTEDAFDAVWLPVIGDANQRKVVIGVLQSHHLIEVNGPVIGASEKAREYVTVNGAAPCRR